MTSARPSRPLPRYAVAGAVIMMASEAAMFARLEPFWSWHTPIAWTGYILLIDGIVWKRRGDSWLTTSRPEFAFLAVASIPLWLVFEFYNLFLDNWRYVNLPEELPVRLLGFAWSFATIWPAMFETGELVASWHEARLKPGTTSPPGGTTPSPGGTTPSPGGTTPSPGGPAFRRASSAHPRPIGVAGRLAMVIGGAMLVWPLVAPSQYLAAPVWLGFILLLDPINAHVGAESLAGDLDRRSWRRMVNLAVSGVVCGVLWEFWNYWANTKWIYSVPILPAWRLFEMPVLGYGGFPAFALECFTMYVSVRGAVWRGPARPISL